MQWCSVRLYRAPTDFRKLSTFFSGLPITIELCVIMVGCGTIWLTHGYFGLDCFNNVEGHENVHVFFSVQSIYSRYFIGRDFPYLVHPLVLWSPSDMKPSWGCLLVEYEALVSRTIVYDLTLFIMYCLELTLTTNTIGLDVLLEWMPIKLRTTRMSGGSWLPWLWRRDEV